MAVVKLIWLIKNKKQITVVSDRHGLERMSKIRKRGEWKLEPHRINHLDPSLRLTKYSLNN